MRRLEGWESRLVNAIESMKDLPFGWGTNDCALFAFNVVRELTGEDAAFAYRDRYSTEFGSRKALKELGDGTLRGSVSLLMGDEISAKLAQRGDLVMMTQESGDTIGVCVGSQSAFVGLERMEYRATVNCVCAWRVG